MRLFEFSPFSLSPGSRSPAAQRRLGEVIALVSPRLPSALKLGHFSSVFPVTLPPPPVSSHPVPCSRAAAVPWPHHQSLPQALVPQGQQERGRVSSPWTYFPSMLFTCTGILPKVPAHPRPPWPSAGCPHQDQEGAQAVLGPSCTFSSAPSSPAWKSLLLVDLPPGIFPLGSRTVLKICQT